VRLTIEIIAALLLLVCISASSAAFAAGKTGRSAYGLGCAFGLPQNASQYGRTLDANDCGDKMPAGM
jgi:hypothetical protein